ncbi:hypothetical protein COB87_002495 [Candidatus Wolfebacteria bacterium]|nr:hypothetical protein [Candidatus Wolfebacteria bacterium]
MLETLIFWGMTFTVVGKATVILAALAIHGAISREMKIDSLVVSEYKKERNFVLFGLALILLGYFLEVWGLQLLPL